MDENLRIDGNTRWVLGAVTNDANEYIRNVRINPTTGAIICEATITSTNTSIGSTIPGATEGSVFFAGPGGTLSQDNANFFWDDTDFRLGLGTDTPAETLDVEGTAIITGDAGTADELLGRDSGTGQLSGVTIGSGLSLSGGVLSSTGGSGGVTSIIAGTDITVSSPTGDVTVGVDISGLANNTTFIGDLTSNTTFQTDVATFLLADSTFTTGIANFLLSDSTFLTDLADNSTFYTELANNTSFISDLTSNSTFISDIVSIVNNPSLNTNVGKIFIDSSDTTLGFVTDKFIAGSGISFSVNNPSGDETLTINATGAVKFGGTGADGALSISSGTNQVDVGGAQIFVLNYSSVSITGSGALQFINPHPNGTIVYIKVSGNSTLTSSATPMIDVSGMGGLGGTGGTYTGNGGSAGIGTAGASGNEGISFGVMTTNFGTGGQPGAIAGVGGAVGVLSTSGWGAGLIEMIGKYPQLFVGAGSGGGAGVQFTSSTGTSVGGNGGNGGGCLIMETAGNFDFTTGSISVAGDGGTDGAATGIGINGGGAGGGGGGAGGSAFIFYNTLVAFTGTVDISGGVGGAPFSTAGNAGEGGGGGGSATNAGANSTATGGTGGDGLFVNAINTEFA